MDAEVFTIYDVDILLQEAESAMHTNDVHIAKRKLKTARQLITDMRIDMTDLDNDIEKYRIIK